MNLGTTPAIDKATLIQQLIGLGETHPLTAYRRTTFCG